MVNTVCHLSHNALSLQFESSYSHNLYFSVVISDIIAFLDLIFVFHAVLSSHHFPVLYYGYVRDKSLEQLPDTQFTHHSLVLC